MKHISDCIEATPRLNFGYYPTPLEELPRLRQALGGGPRIFIKRDDYSGPGFGGNKVRKLEYVLAKAMSDGAEVIVTAGGLKSNHARVTAAMCARLGLRCILVLNSSAIMFHGLAPASLTADRLYGAEIVCVETREARSATMQAIAERLERGGNKVVVVPLGASIPLGALGFVRAAQELKSQMQSLGMHFDYIFHSSSSGGTQAGLIAGLQLAGMTNIKVIGVSPDDPSQAIAGEIGGIIRGIGELLQLPKGALDDSATVIDDYIGDGYGIQSKESQAAIELLARTEGLLLDPVYTSKAMAALIDWINAGRLAENENVLFWHTGGQLALFYAPENR